MPNYKARLSIEELALKHLYALPNDKSGSHLARMRRRFGSFATERAVDNARLTIRMVDPDHWEKIRFNKAHMAIQFPETGRYRTSQW